MADYAKEFGGPEGHTFDLMALDSNAMKDKSGNILPHFTPDPSPGSSGVNLFAQDLTRQGPAMLRPYVFPPLILVGSVLRFLESFKQPCTIVVLDVYPRKYWWPLLQHRSVKLQRLASKGERTALLRASTQGWVPHPGIPGDLTLTLKPNPMGFLCGILALLLIVKHLHCRRNIVLSRGMIRSFIGAF